MKCTNLASQWLENMSSLQMWPVLDASSQFRKSLQIQVDTKIIKIKRVLLAVAQSWSRLIVHDASFCGGSYGVTVASILQSALARRSRTHPLNTGPTLELFSTAIGKGSNWKNKTKMMMMTTKNKGQTKRSHAGS